MLGKCLKYELKAHAKLILPIVAVFGVTWGLEVLLMNIGFRSGDFISTLMWILIFPMMLMSGFSIPFVCSIYSAKRYNDELFSSKAYLMRPLPVKGSTLVLCVFLNTIIWFIFSLILVAAAFLLPTIVHDPEGFLNALRSVMKSLISEKEYWGSSMFTMFLSLIFYELMMMTAVTFASRFNGSRLGFTFLFLIALSFGTSVIHGALMGVFHIQVRSSVLFGEFDTVTVIFRSVLSVVMLVFLLTYADKKADVRQ